MTNRKKAIILAGGLGTRLRPATLAASKQLLTVYDKPLIYYPITTLMCSGVRDILIISSHADIDSLRKLCGDGSKWGVNFQYEVQPRPGGIAQALLIGEKFIGGGEVALILGDNIFYNKNPVSFLTDFNKTIKGAKIFAHKVAEANRYGVVSFDQYGNPNAIEEKPALPKSKFAIPGLYIFDQHAVSYARKIVPSARGELEITDVLKTYMQQNTLKVEILGEDFTWFDAGTFDSLLEVGQFVASTQKQNNCLIGCPEEVAYTNQWINKDELSKLVINLNFNDYGHYLSSLLEEG